jgi:anti-sigma regulatory factor (Ser/Thr protein kinase)
LTPSGIAPLRRQTAAAVSDAGADEAVVAAIRLCVSEALANATMHAYPSHSGVVEISVELDEEEFVVTVRDEGLGLGGSAFHRGGEGGLGLELIGKLTDGFRLTSGSVKAPRSAWSSRATPTRRRRCG